MYKALTAEFIGTAALVLVGCGSVAIGGYGTSGALGLLPVALAFGMVLTGLIYSLGPISGCHINPAVTVALWISERFDGKLVLPYIVSQFLGGAVGAAILVLLLTLNVAPVDVSASGLGQNGWGPGFLGEFEVGAAFLTEALATALFALIILGATSSASETPFAGVAIGAALIVLILCFGNVTGCSLNPARSFGPALFVGGNSIAQLWLFLVAPILGGLIAGLAYRLKIMAPA